MTPSGIEAATFRFVTQHLNQCDTAVPETLAVVLKNTKRFSTNGSSKDGKLITQ